MTTCIRRVTSKAILILRNDIFKYNLLVISGYIVYLSFLTFIFVLVIRNLCTLYVEHNLVLKVHCYQIECMHDQHFQDLQQYYFVNDGSSIDEMCVYMCSCMI